MPNLSPGSTTTVTFTGASTTYTVTAAGIITLKIWGAAGGQSHWLSGGPTTFTVNRFSSTAGGGGGYTWLALRVAVNDQIKIEVGGGGKGSTSSATLASNSPGVGGFPDGGGGAASSATGLNRFYAGGGGSTRVYLNNVLIAVSGGGGGGGTGTGVIANTATVSNIGGAGGGTVGRSTPTVNSNAGATGGSQSAGGVNSNAPSDTGFQGGSLRGGNGYSSTNATPNTITATANLAGPGGGGGYFGGGGCADSGNGNTSFNACGGGGGSGFLDTSNSAVVAGSVYQGYGVLPYGHLDPDYPGGGIGVSPNGTTSGAGVNDGGNGAVVMRFPSQVTLTTSTKQVVTFTGGAVDYICPTAGTLSFKGWGGAGGGSNRSNSTGTSAGQAAGSGFVTFKFDVNAGDVITTMVGRGGHLGGDGNPSNGGKTTSLGHGGWPDGGRGAFDNMQAGVGIQSIAYGGGGGSTRIYLNGVLIGVAAGGGGAGGGTNGSSAKAGAGGGTTGVSADTLSSQLGSTGGSQSAGGLDPNVSGDTGFYGGFLKGGEGNSSTVFDPSRGGGLNNLHKSGPGGGGGYYGGGGSASDINLSTTSIGGGGGSSWWEPSLTNLVSASTTAGLGRTPGGNGDADYSLAGSPGIGCPNTASADGGNGAAILLFVGGYAMPGPITVSNLITTGILVGVPTGSVDTVTMTAPDAAITTGPPPTGDIGTVTLTTPNGSAGSIDPFPVITVENNLAGQPVTEATITVVPSENDILMSLDDPAATVSAGIDINPPFPPDPIGPVVMVAPDASPQGAQNITDLLIGQIDMTAPTGIGENGISVDGPLPPTAITVTVPTVSVGTGFPALFAPLVVTMSRPLATGTGLIGTLAFPSSISMTPPAASVELGVEGTATDLPVTVAMTAPLAR
jgi:hypothetical protein